MFNIKRKIALFAGKIAIHISKMNNTSGTAFPGKVALTIDHDILNEINKTCDKIILVTGTNGKTTSNNLINHVIRQYSDSVLSNLKGANMIQGIITTYVKDTKSHDYGIFEVDEGSLPDITKYLNADYIIINNFFRDQLDRYGELENIVNLVDKAITKIPNATLILNADDPIVNKFNKFENKCINFGLNTDIEEINDSSLILKNCPKCGGKLIYKHRTYGHFGDYICDTCDFSRQKLDYICTNICEYESNQIITINEQGQDIKIDFPYIGVYNTYNVLGVYSLLRTLNIPSDEILLHMNNFSFSLGRMEERIYKDKKIKVILTKNPIGLTEVTRIISKDKRLKSIVHILNDNPADGEDISWIWDATTQCENEETILNYYCSGIRAEEIALKKKYDNVLLEKINIDSDFKSIIDIAIEDNVDIVYILPTYTAVFDTRDYVEKLTTNRKN